MGRACHIRVAMHHDCARKGELVPADRREGRLSSPSRSTSSNITDRPAPRRHISARVARLPGSESDVTIKSLWVHCIYVVPQRFVDLTLWRFWV